MSASTATADHDSPRIVKVQDAKTRLSALLREVENGAEVTIARGDRQVARLVPLRSDVAVRPFGFVSYALPDSFFDELPEDELTAWEAGVELLVDTHVLIWGMAQPDRLSTAAAEALADPDVAVLVSAASAWELATKVRIGKLPGGESLVLDYARNLERWLARELPVSSADALLAGTLSWTHRDPFDRMLAAQALRRGCALVSSDRVFDQVGGVHRIW